MELSLLFCGNGAVTLNIAAGGTGTGTGTGTTIAIIIFD